MSRQVEGDSPGGGSHQGRGDAGDRDPEREPHHLVNHATSSGSRLSWSELSESPAWGEDMSA